MLNVNENEVGRRSSCDFMVKFVTESKPRGKVNCDLIFCDRNNMNSVTVYSVVGRLQLTVYFELMHFNHFII